MNIDKSKQQMSDQISSIDCIFGSRTRFAMMLLLLFCLSSIWSNILTFNFAVICISGNSTNSTSIEFTTNQKTLLTSTVAISTLISTLPVVSLVTRFGIRIVFPVLGILSALATCMIPIAIRIGSFNCLMALRVLQGVAFAANFPVIGSFTSKWTYYKQNGLFVSVLVAYVQLSPAMTMPISGLLCTSTWSWPSVFYVHGIASILLFVIFAIVYRNSPKKHPCVGTIEMAKIAKDKSESAVSKQQLAHIPYASICKSLAVWSIWLAAVGNFCCVNMMFLYSPTYLNSVLGFKVNRTGLSAALPPLAQFLIKLIAGHTSDKIRSIDETNKLRIYNSIAFVGSAICLTTLAFTPTSWPKLCLVLLAMSTGVLGCTTGGFFKAPSLVSRHFSPFVTGNISLANTLTMLVVPFIVTGIAPNNTANEWRFVFVTIAAILVGTNLFFVIACSGAAARWTQITASNKIYPNSAVATTGGDLTIKSVV